MNIPDQPITIRVSTIIKITLTVIAILLCLEFLQQIQTILVFLLVSIIFASGMKPAIEFAGQRGVPRGIAVIVIYLMIILLMVLLGSVVFPPLVQQASFLVDNWPAIRDRLQEQIDEYARSLGASESFNLNRFSEQANVILPQLASGLFRYTINAFAVIVGFISVLVVAYYWLSEHRNIERTWLSKLEPEQAVRVLRVINQIEERWGGWLRGQITLCVVVGVCAYIGNRLLGVPYAGVLGVIAGITEAIPTVGPILGAVPAVLLGLTESPQKALMVAGLYLAIQQLENAILVPKIMEKSVGLSPLTVLLSVLIGGALLGIAGALLAVPVASAVHTIVTDLLFRQEPAPDPAVVAAATNATLAENPAVSEKITESTSS